MSPRPSDRLRVVVQTRREPIVPSAVMGMLIFVTAEVMLFAGLISAFTIIRSGAVTWPPLDQPRLPLAATGVNTAALLASGFALFRAHRAFQRDRESAQRPLALALLLGAFFVVFQGAEWVRLIGQGLTLTSSSLGSFFYLIVGLHALHAVAALAVLAGTFRRMRGGWLASSRLAAAEVFWYFVVGLWPILYLVVYR